MLGWFRKLNGYYVKNVDRIGDEIIVTLGKLAQGS